MTEEKTKDTEEIEEIKPVKKKKTVKAVKKEKAPSVEDVIKKLEAKVANLETAANQTQLRAAERDKSKDPRKTAFLRVFQRKVVVGWVGADDSEVIAQNGIITQGENIVGEVVKIHLNLIDGTSVLINRSEFNKISQRETIFVNTEFDQDGERMWNCDFQSPKLQEKHGELLINSKFVN